MEDKLYIVKLNLLLFLCREKVGSHLLVETSRNPECPKVSCRYFMLLSYKCHVFIYLPFISKCTFTRWESPFFFVVVVIFWTCRWQLWAPLWTRAFLWRRMSLGITICRPGCAPTTWGAASTSCGRPSVPHQQLPDTSKSSDWETISTRSVTFGGRNNRKIPFIIIDLNISCKQSVDYYLYIWDDFTSNWLYINSACIHLVLPATLF